MPNFSFIQAFVRRGRMVALTILLLGLYGAWRLAAPDLGVIGLIVADVAVVGGGIAGMVAAARASERGNA